jgi:hypothetical protein
LDAAIGTLQMRKEFDCDRQGGGGADVDQKRLLADRLALGSSMGMMPRGRAVSLDHRAVVV